METTKSATVLIIEDDEDVRESLSAVVSALGHQCVSFETAESALIFEGLSSCDLMLVDNNLPGMSGAELLSELRRHASEPPACLYTGKISQQLRETAVALENTNLLEKGHNTNAITDYLRTTLNETDASDG